MAGVVEAMKDTRKQRERQEEWLAALRERKEVKEDSEFVDVLTILRQCRR